MKKQIKFLAVALLAFSGSVAVAFAGTASLSVFPATATRNAGEALNFSVGVNTGGNKVCVAEGTVVFNNLSCENITVSDGVMAQSAPTCSKPSFSIGIPSCTIADKILFTVNTKVGTKGTATVSFSGTDIIGEGASLSSASANGNYTIQSMIASPVIAPVVAPAVTPKKSAIPASVKIIAPKAEVAPVNAEPATVVPAEPVVQAVPASQTAAAAEAAPRQNAVWDWIISGVIGFILGYFAYSLRKRSKV